MRDLCSDTSAMSLKILIVEDEFLEARSLSIILKKAGHSVLGIAKTVDQALYQMDKALPEIVLVDIILKGDKDGIYLAGLLDERNIPFIFISANSNASTLESAIATRPYGFLVKPFSQRDILISLRIAIYRYQKNGEFVTRQRNWLAGLLQNIGAAEGAQSEKILWLIRTLTSFLPFDSIMIDADIRDKAGADLFKYHRIGFADYIRCEEEWTCGPHKISIDELNLIRGKNRENKTAFFLNGNDLQKEILADRVKGRIQAFLDFKAKLWLPLLRHGEVEMSVAFYCCGDEKYTSDHLQLLASVHDLLFSVVAGIRQAKDEPGVAGRAPVAKAPNQLLKPGIEGIIGKSPKLLEALDKVTQVAPFDNTVLILGETGVGKEGLVKAIHQLSSRKNKPLIKVNCAAIPVTLVESELFGHEKGAFTGALERRIGKFEQAAGGTLFLDEIGELPLEIQSKLLRALQEKEIERVGGKTTIKTDIRIVAATNRNLLHEIAEGRFRLDLYYRINVFPITLPPLRERREDIPALAAYFLQMYGATIGRMNMNISPAALKQLGGHSWPGNIRELQHVIERHVLACRTGTIAFFEMPEPFIVPSVGRDNKERMKSFADMDRDHIVAALNMTNGKVSGRGGAAEILKLPPTTLNSKIKRLGIKWPGE